MLFNDRSCGNCCWMEVVYSVKKDRNSEDVYDYSKCKYYPPKKDGFPKTNPYDICSKHETEEEYNTRKCAYIKITGSVGK